MTELIHQCEADLPDSLRFGKVEVSCEGWSGPGDPFVVKGTRILDCVQYRKKTDNNLQDHVRSIIG